MNGQPMAELEATNVIHNGEFHAGVCSGCVDAIPAGEVTDG